MRVQAWPRKRGAPKTKADGDRRKIFGLFQRLIKWLGPAETDYIRQAINEHNRTHRGQRGSAAIRFRDWQTQRLYGRGVAVTTDVGIVFYPPAVSRDASFICDHATSTPGQIMERSSDQWGSDKLVLPGQVLTSNGPGFPNSWEFPPQ